MTILPITLSQRLGYWVQKVGGGWSGLVRGPLLLVGLFLLFTWHLTYSRIEREESLAVQNAISDNVNIATVIRANLEQIFGKSAIYADLATALINGERSMSMHLNPTLNGDRTFLRLAVFDSAGRLLHSSARQKVEPGLAAFAGTITQGFSRSPPPGRIIVGRPQSTGDAWRIPVLQGIPHGEGDWGVLVAILDLGYFLRLFQDVHLGPGGRIELISDDGYQLVESNGLTLSAGRDYTNTDYLAFINNGQSGSGLVSRNGEQSKSVVVYFRLDTFPLTVLVSQDYNDLQAVLKQQQGNYKWAAILFSLLVLVGTLSLVVLARRQRAIHLALSNSEKDNLVLIERLKGESKRAFQLASHDHLTGLPNRILFAEMAASHLSRARRSRRYHAVLFIDLDRFKSINDTLGHRVGDLLLMEVAQRFRVCLRESDVAARVGGDEFIILINDVETIEDVEKIAEKIVTVVNEPFIDLDGHDVEISSSIGVALYPRDGEDIDMLLKHADAAMYTAKAAGRGTYRFHDMELNRQALRQSELLQGLRQAIRDGELVLHYQPRVATSDFALTGLEALVRWQHPELGLIFPNDFIPLAEENDLIAPLGLWVIKAVCAQLADWRSRGVPLVPVAVNVSTKQFKDDSLITEIRDALQHHDIPAHLFEIEITESCLVEDPERVAGILTELVAHGVKASMDDYGTGFASLGYLKMLPLHAIKIDRLFIREIHNHTSDAMIVSSITTLAHNLDLLVVAEGVETRDQLVHLKTIGCDQIQGYYFQRPVDAAAIEPVLHEGRFSK